MSINDSSPNGFTRAQSACSGHSQAQLAKLVLQLQQQLTEVAVARPRAASPPGGGARRHFRASDGARWPATQPRVVALHERQHFLEVGGERVARRGRL